MLPNLKLSVEGVELTIWKFKELYRPLRNVNLSVGFSTPYAIYVHENLSANHRNGQAKFLEEPARTEGNEVIRIIADTYRKTASRPPMERVKNAVTMGGYHLLRKAKELVPVDTGRLKNSGYVRVEERASK